MRSDLPAAEDMSVVIPKGYPQPPGTSLTQVTERLAITEKVDTVAMGSISALTWLSRVADEVNGWIDGPNEHHTYAVFRWL